MDGAFEKLLAEHRKEIETFRKVLTSESDRGCVLFAAAYVDAALSDLLHFSFVSNEKIEDDLFAGNAPLATFSARIKMAYYLGLISKQCRQNLDVIRSVRNDFAHKLTVDLFSTQSVRDRCKNLSFSYHEEHVDPRSHFTAAVSKVLAKIHVALLTLSSHVEKADDEPSEPEKQAHRDFIATIMSGADRPPADDQTNTSPHTSDH